MNRTYDATGLGTLFATLAAFVSPVLGQSQARRRPALPSGRAWVGEAIETVRIWQQRARQRTELRRLDDHLLRDVGLTRAQILAEAQKPFWRA